MKKFIEPHERKNLVILMRYLYNLPVKYDGFNMTDYFAAAGGDPYVGDALTLDRAILVIEKDGHHCGTSACVIGHAWDAGIRPEEKPHADYAYTWSDYSADTLYSQRGYSVEWEFLFSPKWSMMYMAGKLKDTQTPEHILAADRIKHYLSDAVISNSDLPWMIDNE